MAEVAAFTLAHINSLRGNYLYAGNFTTGLLYGIQMNRIIFVFSLLFSSFAHANTGFDSQFSHFSGGFFGTALVAYLVMHFAKKHRDKAIVWAFTISMIFVSIEQTRDYILRGKFLGQLYDFSMHTLGTLLAIYLLRKLMKSTSKEDVAASKKQDSPVE